MRGVLSSIQLSERTEHDGPRDRGGQIGKHVIEGKCTRLASIEPTTPSSDFRRTGLICTIGPDTNTLQALRELRSEGLNIVRLNFSHGDYDFHRSAIENVREVQRTQPGRPVAIALDTKGPEIRTGLVREEVAIEAGKEVIVTTDERYSECCDSDYIYIDYKNIANRIKPGEIIFIDDGTLEFEVLEALDKKSLRARALLNGTLRSRKGVNLPDTDLDLPFLCDKDKADIQFGLEHNVDMIFASFVHSADDVRETRRELGERGKHIPVVAKIEDRRGLRACEEIIAEADAVMVARGDLGIEIPHSEVFVAQKKLISLCNIAGKPVICATQMLESMIYNPRPTRAEISDVGNAIMDGADCVMLSSETARGAYPVQAVREMHETCRLAEDTIPYLLHFSEMCGLLKRPVCIEEACAMSAVRTSLDHDAGAIIVLSASGDSARLVSKYRPKCPILMVSRNPSASRYSHLCRGVYPFVYEGPKGVRGKWQEDLDRRVRWAIEKGRELRMLDDGHTVVVSYKNIVRVLNPDAEAAFLGKD